MYSFLVIRDRRSNLVVYSFRCLPKGMFLQTPILPLSSHRCNIYRPTAGHSQIDNRRHVRKRNLSNRRSLVSTCIALLLLAATSSFTVSVSSSSSSPSSLSPSLATSWVSSSIIHGNLSSHNLIFCNAFTHITPIHQNNRYTATIKRRWSRSTIQLFNIDTDANENNGESSTYEPSYYSPNVQLDETRYRYDLDNDNDSNNDNDNESDILNSSHASNDDSPSFNEYSFFDEAIIYIRAGSGGQGSSTYKKGPSGQNAQPDGGDGGRGGDVILQADKSLNTLAGLTNAWRPNSFGGGGAANQMRSSFRPMSFRAENGQDGARQYKNGRFGKDVIIRVPPGTVVQEEVIVHGDQDDHDYDGDGEDLDAKETSDGANEDATKSKRQQRTYLVDLGTVGLEEGRKTLVVGQGGDGGEGSGNQGSKKGRGVRRPRTPPVGGERKRLKLTLKIVADVALVGVPNAGKSTFLSAVTRAKPKIANYPFTTVIPNLGVWVPPSGYGNDEKVRSAGAGSTGLVLCDVPGLIAGAAEGVGLGHAFLRHVERCHVILHLIDATSNDPISDFNMVNREIMRYGNGKLAQMPQIVVVNKIDAWEDNSGEDWEKGLKTRVDKETLESRLREAMTHSRLMWMSAKEKEGVDDLMGRMASFVKKVKEMGE